MVASSQLNTDDIDDDSDFDDVVDRAVWIAPLLGITREKAFLSLCVSRYAQVDPEPRDGILSGRLTIEEAFELASARCDAALGLTSGKIEMTTPDRESRGLALPSEAGELAELEQVIERGLKQFVEVGTALCAIRDRRLYRHAHATFEEYCERRWQLSRRRAYQYIEGAEAFDNVKNFTQTLPANDAQARALAAVKDPEQQRQAWSRAVETAPEGKVTTKHIKTVVRQFCGDPESPSDETKPEVEPEITPEVIASGKAAWDDLSRQIWAMFDSYPESVRSVFADRLLDLAKCLASCCPDLVYRDLQELSRRPETP